MRKYSQTFSSFDIKSATDFCQKKNVYFFFSLVFLYSFLGRPTTTWNSNGRRQATVDSDSAKWYMSLSYHLLMQFYYDLFVKTFSEICFELLLSRCSCRIRRFDRIECVSVCMTNRQKMVPKQNKTKHLRQVENTSSFFLSPTTKESRRCEDGRVDACACVLFSRLQKVKLRTQNRSKSKFNWKDLLLEWRWRVQSVVFLFGVFFVLSKVFAMQHNRNIEKGEKVKQINSCLKKNFGVFSVGKKKISRINSTAKSK